MKNRFQLPLTALLLLMMACGDKDREATPSQQQEDDRTIKVDREQFETNGFELGTLEERDFPEVVGASGTLDVPPEHRAKVSAVLGGFVKKVPFLVGDRVKTGQTLLVLESQEFLQLQQKYLEIHNQLEFLRSEYRRNETLFEENITSQKNYLEAKSKYETSLATHKGLAGQLRMLNISPKSVEQGNLVAQALIPSPIDGKISRMEVSLGSYVTPATEILEVVDNGHLHLELTVFEKDILKVREGQKIRFTVPGASQHPVWGKVHLVGASIDGANRGITVHGHLDRGDDTLLPGMFVEALIMTDTSRGKSLPEGAVIESEGSTYVLKLVSRTEEEFVFQRIPVEPGRSFGGFTEILSKGSLGEDAQFLTKGAFDLLGG